MHRDNKKYRHKKTSKPANAKTEIDIDVTVEASGKPGRPKSPKKRP
jgi:hypothetical protein